MISKWLLYVFMVGIQAAAPPYGQLSVVGTKLVGSNGQEVALHGMSLFWSQWTEGSTFYNYETVQALKCSWNANVVRAAMGVEMGGYLSNPSVELAKLYAVVDAAIDLGIYVIIDWHDHNAQNNVNAAVQFFTAISQKYGSQPNILYETFNEPLQVDWTSVIKPYHQQVVNAIRANDPNNVIILGTPTWSQDVDVAAQNRLTGNNLMYTLHYYAATHKQYLRDKAQSALNQGLPIFVTEYGTVEASGDGQVDQQSSNDWYTFLDNNNISYANWAVENKAEGAAAFQPGTTAQQVGDDSRLTASGVFVKNKLKSQNNGVSCSGVSQPTQGPASTQGAPETSPTQTNAPTQSIAPTQSTAPAVPTTQGGGSGSGSLVLSAVSVNSWTGGAQYKLVFQNTGSRAICGANFQLNMNGLNQDSRWNFDPVTGTNEYTLPAWVNIQPSTTYQDSGFVVSGNGGPPSATLVNYREC